MIYALVCMALEAGGVNKGPFRLNPLALLMREKTSLYQGLVVIALSVGLWNSQ